MRYRPEIDGLRAVAVLPVILFHAGFDFFAGGFIGVDIFFVISGFLITTILINELAEDRFSIARFYERRARRILPALFVVVVACIPLAWLLLLPHEMALFARSIVAVILFVSNILFWRESGYFDISSKEKPLLHTWSLAMEEQYYILFPLFLLLLWRFDRRWIITSLIVMVAISLGLSHWASKYQPSANFYLLPTRAWELLGGSIAAFYVAKGALRGNTVLATLGFIFILIAVFLFDETMALPGLMSVIPVAGTILVLLFANEETLVGKILSMRTMVGIGLISYSAYLWHQPVFAFARISSFEPISSWMSALLIIASLGLAYLTWLLVETPFRNRGRISGRMLVCSIGVSALALTLLGVWGLRSNGFETLRYDTETRNVLATISSSPLRSTCHFPQNKSALMRSPCFVVEGTAPVVAVMGNSHATELAYALGLELAPSGRGVIQHSISDCPHNFAVAAGRETICQRWRDSVLNAISKDENLRQVVLSYRNDFFQDKPIYLQALTRMITHLIQADKEVILVLQAPILKRPINKYLAANLDRLDTTIPGIPREEWQTLYEPVTSFLKGLPEQMLGKFTIIDPADSFCNETQCYAIAQGAARYFDDNHMSVAGARLVAQEVVSAMEVID